MYRQHTSTDGHHGLGVVGAVDVEATDELGGGDDGKGFVLFTAGPVLRWDEPRGAGAGLLVPRLGQAEVGTAPVVGTAGVGGSCRVCGKGETGSGGG